MRHAHDTPAPRDPGELPQGPRRLGQVLQHLEAEHEVVAPAPEGQRARVRLGQADRGAARPAPAQGCPVELHAVEARPRQPPGEILDYDRFAASDLEDPARPRGHDQGFHPLEEARHEVPHHRVARAVFSLVVTAGRSGRASGGQSSRHRTDTSSVPRAAW